jgi:hypothetical protein
MNQESLSYRAAPELWAAAEKFSQNSMDMLNCILELRSRIEVLETRIQHAENAYNDRQQDEDAERAWN